MASNVIGCLLLVIVFASAEAKGPNGCKQIFKNMHNCMKSCALRTGCLLTERSAECGWDECGIPYSPFPVLGFCLDPVLFYGCTLGCMPPPEILDNCLDSACKCMARKNLGCIGEEETTDEFLSYCVEGIHYHLIEMMGFD